MVKNKEYKVITLCGSTRFKDAFMKVQKALTLKGYIVISVGLFGHSGDNEVWTDGTKEMLDDMHKRKIDMADEIFVVDVGGYIGNSTKSEIEYAKSYNKPVHYYSSKDLLHNFDFKASGGYWIEKYEPIPWCEDDADVFYECSVCGSNNVGKSPYCPNCGTKMEA